MFCLIKIIFFYYILFYRANDTRNFRSQCDSCPTSICWNGLVVCSNWFCSRCRYYGRCCHDKKMFKKPAIPVREASESFELVSIVLIVCSNLIINFFYFNLFYRHGKPRPILPTRNTGKDINLLMNTTNSFTTSALTPCNNKKDNLELELDSKDRNHECKNSTESLEKEIPYKTGTLQKVKKTYI